MNRAQKQLFGLAISAKGLFHHRILDPPTLGTASVMPRLNRDVWENMET